MKRMSMKMYTTIHQEHHPMASFLLAICWTVRSMNKWFPTILTNLESSTKVRLLCWRWSNTKWHRPLLINILAASFGLATSHRGQRLWWTGSRCLLNLCQIPIDPTIKTSLTGSKSETNSVKKRELLSPNFMALPGSIIKKATIVLPICLGIGLSRIPWISFNISCTSESYPPETCKEEKYPP